MKINILPYTQLEVDDRWNCWIANLNGYDPTTGAYLRSSNGRRKLGRPKKYTASYLTFHVNFTANNDVEAAKKANEKLNALLNAKENI